jgi:hypothetical protein
LLRHYVSSGSQGTSLADFVEAIYQKRDGLSVSEQRSTTLGDQREEESAAAAHPLPVYSASHASYLVGSRKGSTQPTVLRAASAIFTISHSLNRRSALKS